MGLRDWLDRRRTRKSFGQYVSPAVIALIEQDPKNYLRQPQLQHFQWVLVNLCDRPNEEINHLSEKIIESCFRHQAVISGIAFSLVLAHFGSLMSEDKVENRLALVSDLLAENGDLIRIAHGQCTSLVGNLGSDHRLSWEAVVPGFNAILKKLMDADFGAVIDFGEVPSPEPAAAQD
jgi:hypothetical protein